MRTWYNHIDTSHLHIHVAKPRVKSLILHTSVHTVKGHLYVPNDETPYPTTTSSEQSSSASSDDIYDDRLPLFDVQPTLSDGQTSPDVYQRRYDQPRVW